MRTWTCLLAIVFVLGLGAGCQSTTGESVGRNIDDATITTEVKAKLTADSAANLTRVNVDTTNGQVSLIGNVPTPADRARAEQLARTVKGVQKVANNLQVDKP
jgi:hyperosmotically inducible periplasmic protein